MGLSLANIAAARTALSLFQVSSLKRKGGEADRKSSNKGKKGSTEKQGTPQIEGSRAPKQGGKKGDTNLKLIQAKEVMEELEECKTPTWTGNQIPAILKCPPAPRKKRKPVPPFSSHMRRSSTAHELSFFEEIRPGEVELFFQSMYEFTRVNKKCKSI